MPETEACSCLALNHDHPYRECPRVPLQRGGDCLECHRGLVIRRDQEDET